MVSCHLFWISSLLLGPYHFCPLLCPFLKRQKDKTPNYLPVFSQGESGNFWFISSPIKKKKLVGLSFGVGPPSCLGGCTIIYLCAKTLELLKKKKNCVIRVTKGFPGVRTVKSPPASARAIRDTVRSPGREDPLEEGMAIYSSILAWRLPIDRGA